MRLGLRQHGFWLCAPLIVLADWALCWRERGRIDTWVEAGVLFDLCIVIPALYLVLERSWDRRAWLRAVGLACLGVWLAGHLVPAEEQRLLAHLQPLRWLGLAVLLAVELWVIVALYRAAFTRSNEQEFQASIDAATRDLPPWAARLLAWEAGLWRRLMAWLRRGG